jgi:hypothetical protein
MGGMGHIYYQAISRYADDNEIELEPFLTFLLAIDDEYCLYVSKQNKEQMDKTDNT